jgi:hypothetical protein
MRLSQNPGGFGLAALVSGQHLNRGDGRIPAYGGVGLSAPIKTPFVPEPGVWGFASNSKNKNEKRFYSASIPCAGKSA